MLAHDLPLHAIPVFPIVRRHAQDAIWQYSQFQVNRCCPLMDMARLKYHQNTFAANLQGLLVSGHCGRHVARAELAKWKGPGELFLCFYLTLCEHEFDAAEAPQATAPWEFLAAHPQPHFVDAAAFALFWLPADKAIPELRRLLSDESPLLSQLALNALGLRREPAQIDILPFFSHQSPDLRAEACRYAGRLRLLGANSLLQRALTDPYPAVREQAAIAMLLCNEPQAALPELLAALRRNANTAASGEGAASIRAEARAQHLSRLLGHAIPFPCSEAGAEALLAELPPYLAIFTLAHHGNPALVPQLIRFMDAETDPLAQGLYKRRALWAMSFMLGINPENEGLLSDSPSLSADWPRAPGLDQDTGLPEGDAHKVRMWWAANNARFIENSAPLLCGHPMTTLAIALPLLNNGMQAQRFAAAMHACRLSFSVPWLDTRAPIAIQCQETTFSLNLFVP